MGSMVLPAESRTWGYALSGPARVGGQEMLTMPGSTFPRLRVTTLAALVAVLAVTTLVALPPKQAQAAGHWTGGVLTNNSLDDVNPQLSSTHLVWAQRGGSGWNVRLRELSTGTTTTIVSLPVGIPDVAPDLCIGGDYLTVFSHGDERWYLYQPATDILTAFPATAVTIASVAGTDGTYVVLRFDDGDPDIVVYSIADHGWTKVTNDDVTDSEPRIHRGRIVWETSSLVEGHSHLIERSVMFRDLSTGILKTIVTGRSTSVYTVGMTPRISKDWLGYNDLARNRISLYRLADGLTVQTDGSASQGWILTDDYAFWTERDLSDQVDLYAFDLRALQKTRLTSDNASETLLAGEGGRVVYAMAVGGTGSIDLMVLDLDAVSAEPYRLAQGVTPPAGGWGVGHNISISGDLIAAVLSDGSDNEISWARWVEDEEPPTFTDVPAGHPYAEAIEGLAARGIVSGYDATTFGVNDLVRRQQFAKMIVGTLGLTPIEADFPDPAAPFTDLEADDLGSLYPHEYVAVCARNQITLGKTPTTFDPYASITRAQVISMVVRAADRLSTGTLGTPGASWTGVLDYADATHGANIKRAEFNGLLAGIQGPAGTLGGWLTDDHATRGEVAQILWNLLEKLE